MNAAAQRRLEELAVDWCQRHGAIAARCGSWKRVFLPPDPKRLAAGPLWVRTDLLGFADVVAFWNDGQLQAGLYQVTSHENASSRRKKLAENLKAQGLVLQGALVGLMIYARRGLRWEPCYVDQLVVRAAPLSGADGAVSGSDWWWMRRSADGVGGVADSWPVASKAPPANVRIRGAPRLGSAPPWARVRLDTGLMDLTR